jgi:Peptidase family M1 domain
VDGRKVYLFQAEQPLRYLSFILSKFVRTDTASVQLPTTPAAADAVPMEGPSYDVLQVAVETNPRQTDRGHEIAERIGDIARFYASLVGDGPFPAFTLALVEGDRPGGHSPGYFAALKEPLAAGNAPLYRDDPEVFSGYPEFYLAHELAHQWWGQAVGWRNYHEQWLSEGFAQYFAALYAEHHRGEDRFVTVLRQLRKWAMDESDEGPIYLGYRLGHIRGEMRVFNAIVYNKSAVVLHMLRRLIGDDAFFAGMRRFYRSSRFRKAGTEELRMAMEEAAGRPLDQFFERWIYGSTLPRLKFSYRVDQKHVILHVEQVGDVFDLPLTVRLQYADKKTDVMVPVGERVTEMRVPLEGTLRSADIYRDDGTIANILKN